MPAASVSDEISHLVRDRGYSQKRAVAAAKTMERAGKFRGKKMRMKKKRGHKRY